MYHLWCSSYRETSPVHVVSVTSLFFFSPQFTSLIYAPPSHFPILFYFSYFGLFLFCFTFSQLLSLCFAHLIYQRIQKARSQNLGSSHASSLRTTWASVLAPRYWLSSALARTCNSEVKCRTNKIFVLGHKAI